MPFQLPPLLPHSLSLFTLRHLFDHSLQSSCFRSIPSFIFSFSSLSLNHDAFSRLSLLLIAVLWIRPFFDLNRLPLCFSSPLVGVISIFQPRAWVSGYRVRYKEDSRTRIVFGISVIPKRISVDPLKLFASCFGGLPQFHFNETMHLSRVNRFAIRGS